MWQIEYIFIYWKALRRNSVKYCEWVNYVVTKIASFYYNLVSSCLCLWTSGSSSLTLTSRSDLSDLGKVSYMFSRKLFGSDPASDLKKFFKLWMKSTFKKKIVILPSLSYLKQILKTLWPWRLKDRTKRVFINWLQTNQIEYQLSSNISPYSECSLQ